jgi:hypothetical protein
MHRESFAVFEKWSPLQLAHVLGYRFDIRNQGGGRVIYLTGKNVKERIVTYKKACRLLKRSARIKNIVDNPPVSYRRALIDGREQTTVKIGLW